MIFFTPEILENVGEFGEIIRLKMQILFNCSPLFTFYCQLNILFFIQIPTDICVEIFSKYCIISIRYYRKLPKQATMETIFCNYVTN